MKNYQKTKTSQCLHFWELKNNNIFVVLDKSFWIRFKNIKQKNKDSLSSLAKKLGFSNRKSIEPFIYGWVDSISVNLLLKIIKYAQQTDITFTLNYIEKEGFIKKIKRGMSGRYVLNPKFPINLLNPLFAEFVGFVIAEGDLSKDYVVGVTNKDKELLWKEFHNVQNSFGKIQNNLGKKKFRMIKKDSGAYHLRFPSIMGLILVKMGLKLRKKIRTNYGVPAIYKDFKLNKFYLVALFAFIRGLYSGDGSIFWLKKWSERTLKLYANSYIFTKPKLLIDIKQTFEKLNVKVKGPFSSGQSTIRIYIDKITKKEVKTISWYLKIQNSEDLLFFRDHINFADQEKRKKLDQICNNFNRNQLSLKSILYGAGNIYISLQYLTASLLSERLNASYSTGVKYCRKLKNLGFIKLKNKERNILRYKLTKKGFNEYKKLDKLNNILKQNRCI
ncbi:hypothetical protein MBGDC06_00283 [Thermoplasmatales archaeon SCGC AB-539-C06]|nr:hypothetical protein MBGDC06_00283 [Thermoplasmatales archaeon SCGC AB-539-C06]